MSECKVNDFNQISKFPVEKLRFTHFLQKICKLQTDTDMIYTLPPLPYASDALAPRMSKETIEFHYGKHLQTYIDNLNDLISGTPYEKMQLDEIVMTASGPIFNNAAQVWNHAFFFEALTPEQKDMPLKLKDYLIRDFGSVETFKEQFKKAAVSLFGSGWAWLAQDGTGKLHIIQESNAGNPMRNGYKPLMTIDVWEHAYYIDYRNRRAAFVDNCWNLIDWNIVTQRLNGPGPAEVTETVVITETATRDGVAEAMAEAIIEDERDMQRYVCITCGWIYDPEEGDLENGVPPGTPFSELPADWTCPACGVGKDRFEPER